MREEKHTKTNAVPAAEGKAIKRREKGEEGKIRAYFVRLFGRYNFRNEGQFIRFGKWLIFIVLLFMELFVLMQQAEDFRRDKIQLISLIGLVAIELVLTVSESLKLFVVKRGGRVVYHVIAAVAACGLMFVSSGMYPIIIYLLLLTEFYLSTESSKVSFLMCAVAIPLYAGCYALQLIFATSVRITFFGLMRDSLGFVMAFALHYIAVNIALAFYRQYLRLRRTLVELAESKQELEKAYAVVAEVTALEERQRIAKEIHDTAGHSLTTVIMQTEAAKRIFETEPEEAKSKIIAANLQAKHALEELRSSVHLLSGLSTDTTLKGALEKVLHESSDGTGIKIRSEIAEVQVSPAKFRFICNTLKEGISNGLRHGGATAFWFELKEEDGKLQFLLSDNGTGTGGQGIKMGFGLRTMRERAHAFGGEIHFRSEEDEGFEICLILPTDAEE